MSSTHHYDTVTFDVKDNATMLFFARTKAAGDIEDYLLLMRTEGEGFDEAIYLGWLKARRALSAAVAVGAMRPTHLRGYKSS